MNKGAVLLGTTESVCPVCLRRIKAGRVAEGDSVYLTKTCPDHGRFKTVIWRGQPSYQSWAVQKIPSRPPICGKSVERGCPYDCGLCPEHKQHSCCVLLEITQRCNLHCPVCFAAAGGEDRDPGIGEIEGWYRMLLASGGPYNIQLSGGEPTLRDDLPEIIALGRSLGFEYFQLNTNGVRLAQEPRFVKRLKKAGLSCVFLQFDGMRDNIYEAIRGKALWNIKKAAIDRCAEEGLGVVLVATLVPGVNIDNIGEIIKFGVQRIPAVRGVHLQPVSYFGRYPAEPADKHRITIPEVISEIVRQTDGKMKMSDFRPPAGENAYCSFHGNYILMDDGELQRMKGDQGGCCQPQVAADGARRARAFVAKHWVAPREGNNDAGRTETVSGVAGSINTDSLDAFLHRVDNYSFCISGMAFQDAWNIDLERLQECFLHVASPDKRIIPFCAYNLTNKWGWPIHRQRRSDHYDKEDSP